MTENDHPLQRADDYDSTHDTQTHIDRVSRLLSYFAAELEARGKIHDDSKLGPVEKPLFDKLTPRLFTLTYGSREYEEALKELKPALDHHYANNRHHPQYFRNGLNDMNLLDIVEMLIDWKAATERHNDGDIYDSIRINQKRFGISDQLTQIFINTAKAMGWKSPTMPTT